MSWKPEVQTNDPNWHTNTVRLATREEAEAYVLDLAQRWTSVRDTRVTECDEPISARWVNGRLEHIRQ
jgi:hypothetical protein